VDELLDDGRGDDDDRLWPGKEEFLAVAWAVSGHHGSLVGEWLTPVSGCPETGAPAMGGEALEPCLNPRIRPPLPSPPSASES